MHLNRLCIISILTFLLCLPASLTALMPPHISGSDPLKNNSIVLRGYSLKYADLSTIKVIDETAKKPVQFTKDLTCSWINNCDEKKMPGCMQSKCRLTITFKNLIKGHVYRLTFLRYTAKFTGE